MTDELTKLKSKRKVIRTAVSKVLKNIETEFEKETADELILEESLELLSNRYNELKEIDAAIEPLIETKDLESEISTVGDYKDKVIIWKFRINRRLKNIEPNTTTTVNNIDSGNPKPENKSVRLPELVITKYYGDYMKWTDFFNSFKVSIDNNDSLSKIEKFNYLRSFLGGAALNAIEGFSSSDENYQEAITLLKNRFGRRELIINSHMNKLLNLTPVSKSSDISKLRKLYDSIEIHVRSLKSLDVKPDSYSNMLIPVLFKILPQDLTLEFNRKNPDFSSLYNVETLLQFIKTELECRERNALLSPPFERPQTGSEYRSFPMKQKVAQFRPRKTIPDVPSSAHEFIATINKSGTAEVSDKNCIFCKDEHSSDACQTLNVDEKKRILLRFGRCFLCLGVKHRIKDCKKRDLCSECNGKHNRAICYIAEKKSNEQNKSINNSQVLSAVSDSETKNSILLQTCSASIETQNNLEPIRLLLDNGSMRSFIIKEISDKLNLTVIKKESLSVYSFGHKTPIEKTFDVVKVKLKNREIPGKEIEIEALVTENISGSDISPPVFKQGTVERQLGGLQLSDTYGCKKPIVVLVGADYYYNIVSGKIKRLNKNLVAVETLFGWCLQGQGSATDCNTCSTLSVFIEERLISDQLRKFWDLESIGIDSKTQTSDHFDNEIMKQFESEIKYNNSRYKIKLPWKDDLKHLLKDNKQIAEKRYLHLMKRFRNDPKLFFSYREVLQDYLNQNIIEIVSENEKPGRDKIIYYLPHREVIKEGRTTTKLRVVFDASSHDHNQLSLNDCLYTGPNLYPDIFEMLLSFRLNPIAYTADIQQAFLQIEVDEEDRDVSRFLFPDDPENDSLLPVTYRFTRVLFGVSSSPWLLAATIKHHLTKFRDKFPKTVDFLNKGVYVDDIIGGDKTVEEALVSVLECTEIFKAASMTLHKWQTNSKKLYEKWKKAGVLEDTETAFEEKALSCKVLGISWNNMEDTLYFDFQQLLTFLSKRIDTKRFLLQAIGRIYDPLGFLGPFTLTVECLIQEIWVLGLQWDEELPEHIKSIWKRWCEDVSDLNGFAIPRHYLFGLSYSQVNTIELHCFADASPKAYGVAAYLRILLNNGQVHTMFVASKNRVAPLKTLSLPRLELMGALLAAKLGHRITEILKLQLPNYFWTDSRIVFFWIKGSPVRFKPFVKNRIEEIHALSSPSNWYHCPGKENIGDLVTRGIRASELRDNPLWLYGPEWLRLPSEFWPSTNDECEADEERLELRKSKNVVNQFECITTPREKLLNPSNYSNLRKLLRITGWIKRFIDRIRKTTEETGPLTAEELENVKTYWIKAEQNEFFPEVTCLKEKGFIKDSFLINFAPFLDNEGVLRIGGRLNYSNLTTDEKHPVILPKHSYFTELIVKAEHENVMHCGTSATLAKIRSQFWIPKGRQLVKRVLKKCLICKKYSAKPADQITAQLPEDRINETPPFTVCGIDYIGPVYVKISKEETEKSYILIFTCAVTRAVHLELVTSMRTDCFLLALRRFTARRGNCKVIYSDNAKTFKKAEKEIQKYSKILNDDVFRNFIAKEGIVWKFIVERAAWWGGFYERLVRSVKECMRKILGRALLTFEEMSTVLVEVEAVLNSRPLTYVYNENDEPQPLTPTHFLNFGRKDQTFPIHFSEIIDEGSTKTSLTKRKMYQALLVKQLWMKWKNQYLLDLRTAHELKNPNSQLNLKTDDIVLIEGDKKSKLLWKLAKVIQVYSGRDGKVRSCLLKTSDGTLKRPIQLLYPLEL